MADKNEDDVVILPPDMSLLKKLGNVDLDVLFSPKTIAAAQYIIAEASQQIFSETLSEVGQLERMEEKLLEDPTLLYASLPGIVAVAFSLKTKASMSGYELAASIAKSLQLRAERGEKTAPNSEDLKIILWHIEALKKIFSSRMHGTGGAVGYAILTELDNLEKKRTNT